MDKNERSARNIFLQDLIDSSEPRRSVDTPLLIVDVLTNISDLEDEKNPSELFEIRVVHQNREDEKNSSEFFEID
jgi:hypothetical protein